MKRNLIFSAIAGLSLIAATSAFADDAATTTTNSAPAAVAAPAPQATPIQAEATPAKKAKAHHAVAHKRKVYKNYVCVDMPHLGRIQEDVAKLHLTNAQRQQIRGIVAAAAPKVRQDIEQMRANRAKIDELLQTNYSNYQLNRLVNAQGDLYADLLKTKLQTRKQVLAVLTPEQINQLRAMHAQRRHHRAARHS